jgi:hypothetical protein
MATILNEYYNQDGNFISYVVQNNYGFGVSIKDLDADEYIGGFKIFKNLLQAQEYAIKIAA